MSPQHCTLLSKVLSHYPLPQGIDDYIVLKDGHINDTYRVLASDSSGDREDLVVQRINRYVFKDPAKVMHNIREVTDHVRGKGDTGDCSIVSFLDNVQGDNYTVVDGEYWRVCRFIPNSIAHNTVEDLQVLRSAGYAFGRFQAVLSDLPMDRLHVTIPDFHNTKKRLDDFFQSVAGDAAGRVNDVRREISFFEEHRNLASRLTEMQEAGTIPLRVVHNDTKYNNILMDRDSGEPLCVIDLDTVMPGLPAHDFGDAIRFAGNTAAEDEPDLDKVSLDLDHYRAFAGGYLGVCRDILTETELDSMALGAVTITIEQAARFLADYLNGDVYYKIHRHGQNLDRARCQIALAKDMLHHYDTMRRIVDQSAGGEAL